MINIPARPIWRKVLKKEKKRVESLLGDFLFKMF